LFLGAASGVGVCFLPGCLSAGEKRASSVSKFFGRPDVFPMIKVCVCFVLCVSSVCRKLYLLPACLSVSPGTISFVLQIR
jgi:hypothetical protein